MNADRLNALLHVLSEDLNKTRLPQRIDRLSNALHLLVQQPNPNHQQAVGEALKDVYKGLDESEVDDLSPAWKEMLSEIGFASALGSAARNRLSDSLRQVDVTPTLVREDVEELKEEITKLSNAVAQGISAFDALSIGYEQLKPGECELGFMVPRAAIDFRLDEFARECGEFDFIFGTFSEVATGRRGHYRISTISSSDFSVFLESAPAVAALVAATAERLLAAYKQLLEIRKLRSELAKQDVPKQAFKDLDEHANAKMDNAINEIVSDVMTQHGSKHETGRKNELMNSLRISLRRLASRFDRGYHIEVRIGLLPEPEAQADEVGDELRAHAEAIQKAAKPLEFIRLEGEPILSLAEAEGDAEPSASNKKGKR